MGDSATFAVMRDLIRSSDVRLFGFQQSDAYVRVAVGRDYADVPPTRGVYKGIATETLSVRVALQSLS